MTDEIRNDDAQPAGDPAPAEPAAAPGEGEAAPEATPAPEGE